MGKSSFRESVLHGGFRSFSHQVRSYVDALEHLADELEDALGLVEKRHASDDDTMAFCARMRDLLGRAAQSARGEQ